MSSEWEQMSYPGCSHSCIHVEGRAVYTLQILEDDSVNSSLAQRFSGDFKDLNTMTQCYNLLFNAMDIYRTLLCQLYSMSIYSRDMQSHLGIYKLHAIL